MSSDWTAAVVTLKLALITALSLCLLALPVAFGLSRCKGRLGALAEAVVALPLVLPPTVLGFYLLWLFSPRHPLGSAWQSLTGTTLAFSFTGLWLASMLYSLPFAVQPLRYAFDHMGARYREAADMLGLSRTQRWRHVTLPLLLPALVMALVLAFAHTVGEFGVVLMIGGNIPGETRVLSIALFDHVETFDMAAAHRVALGLLVFSVGTLWCVYRALHRWQQRWQL